LSQKTHLRLNDNDNLLRKAIKAIKDIIHDNSLRVIIIGSN